MSDYTPGPWRVTTDRKDRGGEVIVSVDSNRWVLDVGHEEYDTDLADARLIAAAPALLEAARRAEALLDSLTVVDLAHESPDDHDADPDYQTLQVLRAAIAQAEGGQA